MTRPDDDGTENRETVFVDPAALFKARFQQLVDLTGVVPNDLVDTADDHEEHMRYAVYCRVVDLSNLRPFLLACLAEDPDPLMASDVLVKVLEQVDASERPTVVNAASGWRVGFAQQHKFVRDWARDLDQLDALRI